MTPTNAFVKQFEAAWRDPVARFANLFHADGTLYQQGMERPITKDEISSHVARVLSLIPDQRIEVKRWAVNGEDVFIEWTASATFGDKPVSWSGASRFTLREGLIMEEIAYFDTLPLRALIDPSLRRGDMTSQALAAADQPRSRE
jgi:uncharacterized protein (TIGR02246 family)